MMMSVVRVTLLCAAALLLWGCGGLLPTTPAPDLYNLTPKSTFNGGMPSVPWQLVIEEPLAARGLDSTRIAVRPSSTQLKYLSGVRWTNRAPKMVQTLLVESFENSGKILAVGRQAIGLRSDCNLKTELREFQLEFNEEGEPVVRVRINAKMIRQPAQEIIASETFERIVKAESQQMAPVVAAFDEALGGAMKRLVEWALKTPVDK